MFESPISNNFNNSIVLTRSKNGEIHILQRGEIGKIPKSAKFRIREIDAIPPENGGKFAKGISKWGKFRFSAK